MAKQEIENKIILLHVLSKLPMPITGICLTDIVLEPGLVSYLDCQLSLQDLIDTDLVDTSPDSDGIPMYTINQKGREILDSLKNVVPPPILLRYANYIKEELDNIKHKLEVNASYFTDSKGDYYVRCFVRDQTTYIIDIKIPVSSKSEADLICRNWRESTSKIYTSVLKAMYEA